MRNKMFVTFCMASWLMFGAVAYAQDATPEATAGPLTIGDVTGGSAANYYGQTVTLEGNTDELVNIRSFVLGGGGLNNPQVLVLNNSGQEFNIGLTTDAKVRVTGTIYPSYNQGGWDQIGAMTGSGMNTMTGTDTMSGMDTAAMDTTGMDTMMATEGADSMGMGGVDTAAMDTMMSGTDTTGMDTMSGMDTAAMDTLSGMSTTGMDTLTSGMDTTAMDTLSGMSTTGLDTLTSGMDTAAMDTLSGMNSMMATDDVMDTASTAMDSMMATEGAMDTLSGMDTTMMTQEPMVGMDTMMATETAGMDTTGMSTMGMDTTTGMDTTMSGMDTTTGMDTTMSGMDTTGLDTMMSGTVGLDQYPLSILTNRFPDYTILVITSVDDVQFLPNPSADVTTTPTGG